MIAGLRPVDAGRAIDQRPLGGYQRWLVFLTALTIVFDGIDNQLLGVTIPSIMADWHVPRSAFAPIVALGYLGMMIGGAVAGLAGDRFGRRSALLGCMVIFGGATLAVSTAGSVGALATLRLVAGIGLGGAMPNAAALAAEFVPVARRAIAVTLTIVCVPLGATLAGLIAIPALPAFGWRALFVLGGVVPIVAALVLFWLLPESPRYLAGRPERWEELRRLLRRMGHPVEADATFHSETGPEEQQQTRAPLATILEPGYRRDSLALWAAFFSCLLSVYMVFSWLPTILTSAGLGASVASSGITLFNLGGVAGAVGGGFLIGRFGSRPTMLTITGLAIVGAIVLSLMSITSQTSVTRDPRDARLHRRDDQRRANDDVRAGRACLPHRDARDRCRRGSVDRTRRRDPERLCGPLGARLSRQHIVLRLDGCRAVRDVRRAGVGAAARGAGGVGELSASAASSHALSALASLALASCDVRSTERRARPEPTEPDPCHILLRCPP